MSSNSHKKKREAPQLYQSTPHTATQISISPDLRRVKSKTSHFPSQLQTAFDLPPAPPSAHATSTSASQNASPNPTPSTATNPAMDLFGDEVDDSILEGPTNVDAQDGVHVVVRKRYTNSTNPMAAWVKFRETYLETMLADEGRRDAGDMCAHCKDDKPALFRCRDDECVGGGMLCEGCCCSVHERQPLHWVERWNGTYFEHINLSDMGVSVQLMHAGSRCPFPETTTTSFVVIHTNGIHHVSLCFCGCSTAPPYYAQLLHHKWYPATPLQPQTATTFSLLKLFQHLNTIGKLPTYDLWKALETMTENNTTVRPPDRYGVLRRSVRQFRHLRMAKRAGRGHSDDGIAGTLRGELAIQCPACPHPGMNMDNLPEGDKSWLGRLFLAVDGNFRARNAMVSSTERDPPLADGKCFFIEQAPYLAFVRNHASEEDINTCSGFRATQLADLKKAKGLRTTGVVGVTCSRHGLWRANGMGNLQRGERFCNVDPVVSGSTMTDNDKEIVLSFDVACIYDKNFWARMRTLPVQWRMERDEKSVYFCIPKLHFLDHKPKKHAIYSFNFRPGVGRTHGETIEENWSISNKAAAQTKVMGPGARQDTLEDIWNHHNWRTMLAFERTLASRLVDAIKEAGIHINDFKAFTDSMTQYLGRPVVNGWRKEIIAWEADHEKPCPYEPPDQVYLTLNEVKLQLLKEEQAAILRTTGIVHESSIVLLLNLGLEIEVLQRALAWEVKARSQGTTYQELNVQKQRSVIAKKIVKLRGLQRIFMPHLEEYLTAQQLCHWDVTSDINTEERSLFLPSELDTNHRTLERACPKTLIQGEERLREAESREALEGLRSGLRMRSASHTFTVRNVTGQNPTTRAENVQRNILVSIQLNKLHYKHAWSALLRLRGPGKWTEELQELKDTDVRSINERLLSADEAAERERLHNLGIMDESAEGLPNPASLISQGEGRRHLSWIWYAYGPAPADIEEAEIPKVHATFKIEWAKSRARMYRWREEIELLIEEMTRVVRYGRSRAVWWRERKESRSGVNDTLREGLVAYAEENAVRCESRSTRLESKWSMLMDIGRDVLAGAAVTRVIDFVIEEDEVDNIEEADELEDEE